MSTDGLVLMSVEDRGESPTSILAISPLEYVPQDLLICGRVLPELYVIRRPEGSGGVLSMTTFVVVSTSR